jgi:hypothetical protein
MSALAFILGALLVYGTAKAEPLFRASAEGTTITLYDEPCKLPEVENLKNRATWEEKGKVTEGCYGGHPQFPLVLFYFADKAVTIVPVEVFKRMTGA